MNIVKTYSDIFSVLSDENRLKIYLLLLLYPDGLYVCEINQIINLPYYTVSKSLKELENIKIVKSERYGQFILYSLDNTENIENFSKKDFHSFISKQINLKNIFEFDKIKELIEKNNGKFWIKSELGKGTAFYFSLPAATEK